MTTGTPGASATGSALDPARCLAAALSENAEVVAREVEGLGPLEADRALFFLLSAYDISIEMWFQKGDPTAPVLTNWELPWRKYGGDNPTTIYLSAPVSPGLRSGCAVRSATRCTRGCRFTPNGRDSTSRRRTSPTPDCYAAVRSTC